MEEEEGFTLAASSSEAAMQQAMQAAISREVRHALLALPHAARHYEMTSGGAILVW